MIKIPSNIKALLFDCDGTLADTMPIHIQAWKESFNSFDKKCPVDFIDSMKGAPIKEIVKAYNAKYNDDLDPTLLAEEKYKFTNKKLQFAEPIEVVTKIVKDFKDLLPSAVVSGGTKNNVLATLKAIGLENHFDTIITADNNLRPKPNPDMFLEAAKILNVEPEYCLVFEDGDLGIEGAKKANMQYVDVREYL